MSTYENAQLGLLYHNQRVGGSSLSRCLQYQKLSVL